MKLVFQRFRKGTEHKQNLDPTRVLQHCLGKSVITAAAR